MWLARLEANPLLSERWLSHPHRDAYWKHGSICEDFSNIQAAVLAVGGWGDAYSNAVPRLVEGIGGAARGIIGPWAHKYPHFAIPDPKIGFLQEALRWWDQWLKGEDTGVLDDPQMRTYIQDNVPPKTMYLERPGRWVADNEWPGNNAETKVYHLGQGVLLEEAAGDTSLNICSPVTAGVDGGEYCVIWLGPEFPGDQNRDDAGSLCFETAQFTDSIDIFGAPSVEVSLSADKPFAQIAVRLNAIAPDGAATRITYGVLNLCHRDSHETPEPLEPGKTYKICVQLDDIAYRLPPQHKLRLAISTCYWPLIWPSPERATLTLKTHESRFHLPIRGGDEGEMTPFQAPETAAPLKLDEIRAPENRREFTREGNVNTLKIHDDFGEYRDTGHGLVHGEIGRETHAIADDDPLSARSKTHWTQTYSRDDGWSIRTETFQEMWASETHFHINARIEAYQGDELVFEKNWTGETVVRQLV